MSFAPDNDAITLKCGAGHSLMGNVKYCPYCGIPVVSAASAASKAETKLAAVNPAETKIEDSPASKAQATPEPASKTESGITPTDEVKLAPPAVQNDARIPAKKTKMSVAPNTAKNAASKKQSIPPSQQTNDSSATRAKVIAPTEKKSSFPYLLIFAVVFLSFKALSFFSNERNEDSESQVLSSPDRLPPTNANLDEDYGPDLSLPAPLEAPLPQETEYFETEEVYPSVHVEEKLTAVKPADTCPVSDIDAEINTLVQASQFIEALDFLTQKLQQNSACKQNRNLLLLQDVLLQLKQYKQTKNARHAVSGFEALIYKYGNEPDLIELKNHFASLIDQENDCAASGGDWNPDAMRCTYLIN